MHNQHLNFTDLDMHIFLVKSGYTVESISTWIKSYSGDSLGDNAVIVRVAWLDPIPPEHLKLDYEFLVATYGIEKTFYTELKKKLLSL